MHSTTRAWTFNRSARLDDLHLFEDVRRGPAADRLFASVGQDQSRQGSRRLGQGSDAGPSQGGSDQTGHIRLPARAVYMDPHGNALQPPFVTDPLRDQVDQDETKKREHHRISPAPIV